MVIRWGDIDPARLDRFTVVRMKGGKRSGLPQYIREEARAIGRHVPDDEECRRDVAREPRQNHPQGFQSSRRSANDDDIMSWHSLLL
jgi:hypothetical protein